MTDPRQTGPSARGQPRSSMFLAAVLRAGTEQVPVQIRNLSPNGAMVDSPLSPPSGTEVQLVRGSLIAKGRVIWSSDNRCGLRFSTELSVKEWLAAPAKAEQERVDVVVSQIKAGAFPISYDEKSVLNASPAHQPKKQLVDDLEAVVKLMQALENDLASCDETLARHGAALQNLDIAMQMIRAIGQEMSSGARGSYGNVAGLEDLRVVCAQALATR